MSWKDNGFLYPKRERESFYDDRRKELSANTDNRNATESDFGRVIYSPACRRLHDKTQVFPLTTNDNIHSRLTHSLEVMNMGLSFSINLSNNEEFLAHTELSPVDVLRTISAMLKTSCIVHDIGNPPFGHFGEEVIQDYFKRLFVNLRNGNHYINKGIEESDYISKSEKKKWNEELIKEANRGRMDFVKRQLDLFLDESNTDWQRDYTEFDGNAEGLRILSRLQNAGDLYGLNLTLGTLAASIKYPNTGESDRGNKTGKIGNHKHGVMFTEKKLLELIAEKCELKKDGFIMRHPLSFLMEAADSICYLVMDIDDAIAKKWVSFEDVYHIINDEIDEESKIKITNSYNKILGENKSKRKRWMSLRTAILGYLMEVATNNFVKNLVKIENGEYNYELIEDKCVLTEKLQDFTSRKILSQRDINLLETTGKSVVSGLLDHYIFLMFHSSKKFRDRAKVLLSKSILYTIIMEHIRDYKEEYDYKYDNASADDVYDKFDIGDLTVEERLRAIRDYIVGMTDKFALNHYRELSGQSLS